MGHIIEITEDRMESLSEHIEQGLRHLGKAMQCVDEWMRDGYGYGERRGYQRGYVGRGMDERGYGERGMDGRDDDDMDDDDMGERYPRYYGRGYGERRGGRRRDSRGRYM